MFFSFLFPVMLLLIFGTVFGATESVKYTLHIQNFDLDDGKPTNLSDALIKALDSTGTFDLESLDTNINITRYVKENPSFSSYRILIIPEGFEQTALNKSISVRMGVIIDTLVQIEELYGSYMNESERENITQGREALSQWKNATLTAESAELLLLTDQADQAAPIVKGIVYSVVNAFNNELIGGEEVVNIATQPLVERRLKPADYYLPGYIAAFIMTNGIIGVTSTVSEYRRNGTIKRIVATPLNKSSWILANVGQQTLLAFLLMIVMVGLGWLVFGVRALPDHYALSLIFIGAVTFCCIGIVLGGVIKDVEAATGAGNAIAFPMMFLSGAFWPVEMMPSYLQTVAKFLPLYYFHQGLRNIMIYQNPAEACVAFLVLGSLAIIFVLLAIKVTKWKDL
ncbi:MAG: ABC transporter permease [Candidatus Thermoplasmatota archaeon]|nr:ABC transporter permease [Candidatus Thermoplasmatota archaeon]